MPGAALQDLVHIEGGCPEGFGVGDCVERGRPQLDCSLAPLGGASKRNWDRDQVRQATEL